MVRLIDACRATRRCAYLEPSHEEKARIKALVDASKIVGQGQ